MIILKKLIIVIFVSFFCFISFEQAKATTNYTFKVEPIYTEQITSASYFYVRGRSGEKKVFKFTVTNLMNEPITLTVHSTNAFSNPFGSLHYTDKEETEFSHIIDKRYKFTQYANVPAIIQLDAHEAKEISIEVQVPANLAEGQLLGGIKFQEKQTNEKKEDSKNNEFSIDMSYQYIVAVLIELTKIGRTHIEIGESTISKKQGKSFITIEMTNLVPVVARDLYLDYSVFKKENYELVLKEQLDLTTFAPVTSLKYPIELKEIILEKGDYILEANVIDKHTKKPVSAIKETLLVTSTSPDEEQEQTDLIDKSPQVTDDKDEQTNKNEAKKKINANQYSYIGGFLLFFLVAIICFLLKRRRKDL